MAPAAPTEIGRYQVVRSLGEGGMGAVYLARDPAIDRLVAIKLMRKGYEVADLRQRFSREAKSIGRLHHPNIVTIFDVGDHQGEPFIAMEYVDGRTLGALIVDVEHVPVLQRLAYIDGLFAGLQYAHRAGIVHRDIKPANVMIETDGGVKILDFGIAHVTSSMTEHATQAGTILGTLNYMSPEQLSGKPVDHRTDIFSAGAVFYELMCGQQAFPGDIQSGVLTRILSQGPKPMRAIVPGLHPSVIAVVEKCLARDVDERYADLGAARRDLDAVRRQLEQSSDAGATIVMPSIGPVVAPPSGAPSVRVPTTHPPAAIDSGATVLERPPTSSHERHAPTIVTGGRNRTGMWVTVGAIAIGVAAFVVWMGLRGGGGPASAPTTSAPPTTTAAVPEPTPAAPTPAPAPVPLAVRIDISPWARIEAIEREVDGRREPVDFGQDLTTPCVVQLPAGRYHLRASNPAFPQAKLDAELVVTGAGQLAKFTLPGVSADALAKEIIK